MPKVTFTIFANFFIDNQERFLRLKDSFNSIESIDIERFVINVRGRYAQEVISFLHNKVDNIDIYSIESSEGWFYDTSKLIGLIHTKYLFLWVEDHICLRPEKVNLIVNQMNKHDIEILTYSFWCNGAMLNRYGNVDQEDSEDLSFFDHTINNNNLVQNNQSNIRSFIISFASIIRKDLFVKVIKDGGSESRWNKMLPFDFEKSPDDESWLPLKRGVPKYEIFASIDDDLNTKNSSLQNRGLYPIREGRKTYAQKERRIVILLRKIKNNIKRVLKLLVNTLLTPSGFRLDYLDSFRGENDAIKIINPIPVINYKAIKYLESRMTTNNNIFEYGSGQSTQYWLNNKKKVVSIEHSNEFYGVTQSTLVGNVDYKLIEPEIQNKGQEYDPLSYKNYQSTRFKGYSFERYVKSINSYNDEFFDTIIVDGRARASCMFHSISKLKPGGMLILDNSDRDYYLTDIKLLLDGWDEHVFRGSVRGLAHQEQTTIFVKPI